VSMNTFILGIFAILFAYFNKIIDIFQTIFIGSICLMQLIEYFLWRNIKNKKKNIFWSNAAVLVLFIQPILSILTIPKNPILLAFMAIYLSFILFSIINRLNGKNKHNKIDNFATIGKNKHLRWNWLAISPYRIFFYVFFLLAPLLFWKDKFVFLVILATFVLSLIFFSKDGTWGSMWCWSSNIISLYLIYRVFSKELCK
jgi:hypothetical protein